MRRTITLLILICLFASGCGRTLESGTTTVGSEAAVTVTDFEGRKLSFQHVPEKIVALSNGEMDIIYALGGKLVGRPTSTAPSLIPEAAEVAQIGSPHEVDLEKIAFLKPDVVLGTSPMNTKDIPAISNIGSTLLLTRANSVEDIKQQIRLLGELLQKNDKADELIRNIDEKLNTIQSSEPGPKPRVLIVYGAPGTNMAALPNSLAGDLVRLAGGDNIAARFPALQSYPQYAQLNSERIIQANPDIIYIMTHGNPEEVKASLMREIKQNAAWDQLSAVRSNRITVLPSDLFGTNPGTRIVEALELLRSSFAQKEAK